MSNVIETIFNYITKGIKVIKSTEKVTLERDTQTLTLEYKFDGSDYYVTSFRNLIFKGDIGYFILGQPQYWSSRAGVRVTIGYQLIDYQSYFEELPVELSVLILSKLIKVPNVKSFLSVLEPESSTKEFTAIWKNTSGKWYFDPRTMPPTDHLLVKNLYDKLVELNKGGMYDIKIHDVPSKDRISIIKYPVNDSSTLGYIGIRRSNFDIVTLKNQRVGNLYDEPYHGLDLIDSNGLMIE